jgi:hypothetical protein
MESEWIGALEAGEVVLALERVSLPGDPAPQVAAATVARHCSRRRPSCCLCCLRCLCCCVCCYCRYGCLLPAAC